MTKFMFGMSKQKKILKLKQKNEEYAADETNIIWRRLNRNANINRILVIIAIIIIVVIGYLLFWGFTSISTIEVLISIGGGVFPFFIRRMTCFSDDRVKLEKYFKNKQYKREAEIHKLEQQNSIKFMLIKIILLIFLMVVISLNFNQLKSGFIDVVNREASFQKEVQFAYELYTEGKYEACITYVKEDMGLENEIGIPYTKQLCELLGASYFELEDYHNAAFYFRLSIDNGDITVPAMRDYAVSLGRLGDIATAQEVLSGMLGVGANEWETQFVQAEMYYATDNYIAAEQMFRKIFSDADNVLLQTRAMRTLAEIYRECTVMEKSGKSLIEYAARKEVEVLTEGQSKFVQYFDTSLWEMLAQAYYEAYHNENDPYKDETWLNESANAFQSVINGGIKKEYLFANLFYINMELESFVAAENVLVEMKELYPNGYTVYALNSMLLITLENEKEESERDYLQAYADYNTAKQMLRSGDDGTHLQQLESMIESLKAGSWL